MKFKESELAHKYCIGHGLELGAAAHNPFGLKDCLNVAPDYDFEFFKQSQVDLCGEFSEIDIFGTASAIPVESSKFDYVVSSHVIEHVSDPIQAFWEWNRVLKPNGIIFMIFPKRDALPSDVGRPLSGIADFIKRYNVRRAPADEGHIWVFSLQSMIDLIEYCNKTYSLGWGIIEALETDDKVGNGHTIVCRKI